MRPIAPAARTANAMSAAAIPSPTGPRPVSGRKLAPGPEGLAPPDVGGRTDSRTMLTSVLVAVGTGDDVGGGGVADAVGPEPPAGAVAVSVAAG